MISLYLPLFSPNDYNNLKFVDLKIVDKSDMGSWAHEVACLPPKRLANFRLDNFGLLSNPLIPFPEILQYTNNKKKLA
jgi:hypothetical protein